MCITEGRPCGFPARRGASYYEADSDGRLCMDRLRTGNLYTAPLWALGVRQKHDKYLCGTCKMEAGLINIIG